MCSMIDSGEKGYKLPEQILFNSLVLYLTLSSLSSKLELKGLVKPETASSTHTTLHLSRLNISFQCIEELFQYIEL